MAALFSLIPLAAGIVFAVVWVHSLVHWNGQGCDPGEDCNSCPFPCDKNQNQKEEK